MELDCIRSRGQQWARGSFLLRASVQDDSRLAFWTIGFSIAHGCSVVTWLAKVAENFAGWRTCRVSVTYLLA